LADPDSDHYIKNSSYYAIGHFSKYIQPRAKRLHQDMHLPEGVSSISYRNPDQSYVIVLLNEIDENIQICIEFEGKKTNLSLKPRSLTTLISK
ncbi:MAG TPA: glycoside hydrolase family 30 beta sandwich domain-containing protein, partial [Acholeplasmataceae bacterium]|nr:glycoside hydrolase family 30 beta sandwich domain-containing protein [Acholeplasmataceae bacterium]